LRHVTLGSFGAALLAAASASGQAPAQSDPALQAVAKQFEEGKRLFREGTQQSDPVKLERAYFDFKAAYAVYQGKGTLLNLVESELATNRTLDAMRHLREYVRANGTPEEHSEYRRSFQQAWNAALAGCGHLEIEAAPSLRIVLDGKDEAGVTPIADPIDVTPGHHVIESSGSEKLRAEVDAFAGSTEHVRLFASAPPPAPAAAPTSAPEAIPPAAEQPRAPVDGSTFWTGRRVWGVGFAGAGAVSIGLGAFFAVQAQNSANRATSILGGLAPTACASSQSAQCQQLQSAHDDQSRDHTLNLVFVTVGVAAMVAGAALFLWPQSSPSKTAIVPVFAPQGAGLQLRGDF